MAKKLIEHLLSIFFVTAVFALLIHWYQQEDRNAQQPRDLRIEQYLQLGFIDFGDPLDKALFKETLDRLFPDSLAQNAALLQSIDDYRREQFTNERYKTGVEERGLTRQKIGMLFHMFFQFVIIYVIVMGVTYYAAQTLGIIRFVQMKQHRSSYLTQVGEMLTRSNLSDIRLYLRALLLLAKAVARGAASMLLFAPAYVIAYSIKTDFQTDSYIFMILLGAVSNGLLINYANRFYTFLVSESRKGYVETAFVKNLNHAYAWNTPDGIATQSVFRLKKEFPSHVFDHVYTNARHQFRATLKEHASFLITGLVIIEMALNIQGHLSYEMLKNILYKQYDVVLSIVLGIFLLVKATEIVIDVWTARAARRYENT